MRYSSFIVYTSCADPEGVGTGGSDPPVYHKNIGFLSNTGPDPLGNHNATKPTFNAGPAKHHLNGVSLVGRSWPAFSGIWILSTLFN